MVFSLLPELMGRLDDWKRETCLQPSQATVGVPGSVEGESETCRTSVRIKGSLC